MILQGFFEENDGLLDRNRNQWLPLTELSVKFTNGVIERDLGRIDMFTASEFLAKREVSPEVMVTALMYVSRYKRRKDVGEFKSTMNGSFTSADLFLVSMMLASKYLFDDGIEENVINEEWAEDFGIETEEINALEIDFLVNMDWKLFVSADDYKRFKAIIGKCVWRYLWDSHIKTGSTYCELTRLDDFTMDKLYEVLKWICRAIAACTLVYVGMVIGIHLAVPYSLHSDMIRTSQVLSISHIYSKESMTNNTKSSFSNVFQEINKSHNLYTIYNSHMLIEYE